eukprot:2656092-Amphidinium_carterae.1
MWASSSVSRSESSLGFGFLLMRRFRSALMGSNLKVMISTCLARKMRSEASAGTPLISTTTLSLAMCFRLEMKAWITEGAMKSPKCCRRTSCEGFSLHVARRTKSCAANKEIFTEICPVKALENVARNFVTHESKVFFSRLPAKFEQLLHFGSTIVVGQHTDCDPTNFWSSSVKVIDTETDLCSDDWSQLLSLKDENQGVRRVDEQDVRIKVSFSPSPRFFESDQMAWGKLAPVGSLALKHFLAWERG